MTKIDFIITCNAISVEPGTNNPTFSGVFSNIDSNSFPAMHPRMFVVAGFTTDILNECNATMTIRDPDSNEIATSRNIVKIGKNGKAIWANEFIGITVTKEGAHTIEISINGSSVGSSTFTVQKV